MSLRPNDTTVIGMFRMSNGDLLKLDRQSFSSYSTDNGVTWSARVQPSGSAIWHLLKAVPSTTNPDVLYILHETLTVVDYLHETHGVRGGIMSYTAATHTLALTTYGNQDWVTTDQYGHQSNDVIAMVNDGTRIHFLHDFAYDDVVQMPYFYGALVSTWGTTGLDHNNYTTPVHGPGNLADPNGSYDLVLNPAGTGLVALASNAYYAGNYHRDFSVTEYSVGTTTYTELNTVSYQGVWAVMGRNQDGFADVVYVATTSNGTPVATQHVQRQSSTVTTTPVAISAVAVTPDLIAYLLDAGQYRLIITSLAGCWLNIYKLCSGTPWTYAGAVSIPYNISEQSANLTERYESVQGVVPGIVLSIAYDEDYYYNTGPGGYAGQGVTSHTLRFDTNSSPIVAQLSPINRAESFDQVAEAIPLVWSFTDADDATPQTKRQVRISENTPNATIYFLTTGGTLTVTDTEVTTAAQTVSIPAGSLWATINGYQWQVRAMDIHGAWSVWTEWASFSVSGRPSASITNPPASNAVASNRPVITWIYSDPEVGAESASNVRLYDLSGNLLWDGGALAVLRTVASGTSDSRQIAYTLTNNATYSVGVLVADNDGIWSSEAKVTFLAAIVYPPAPTVGVTFDASGIATVTVTESTPAANQSAPVSCDLYRWSPRLSKFVLMSSGLLPTFTVFDVAGPSNTTYRYKVVTTGANGSVLDTLSANVSYDDSEWRLLTATANIVLSVDEMNFETPMSQDTLEPMGRDHPIVVTHGTRGVTGQISASLIASERISVRDAVEALANTTEVVYLRNPFGEVFAVSLGSIAETPVTGGSATLVIPFTEVADA